MFFVPAAKLIALLPPGDDVLVLHRFDADAALAKSGHDFLYVASRPPISAARGKPFAYVPRVRSSKGGVVVRVQLGPPGMTVEANGRLTWAVPAGYADPEAIVILTVRDADGREVFHSFKLVVRDA